MPALISQLRIHCLGLSLYNSTPRKRSSSASRVDGTALIPERHVKHSLRRAGINSIKDKLVSPGGIQFVREFCITSTSRWSRIYKPDSFSLSHGDPESDPAERHQREYNGIGDDHPRRLFNWIYGLHTDSLARIMPCISLYAPLHVYSFL